MPLPTLTDARTPTHDLPYLFPGQAQKEAFVNEALARIDAALQPVVRAELSAPPPAPLPGEAYLVTGTATGEWAGHGHAIALWAGNQWLYNPPREGGRVYDLATASFATYSGIGGWQRIATPAAPSGGTVQDIEARDTLATVLAALRAAGVFSE